MKTYLIHVDNFGAKAVESLNEQQRAQLTVEFGRKALGETWARIHNFLTQNGLYRDVEHLTRPKIAPFFIITCTENVAARLLAESFPGVKAIYEATMPLELPDWDRHLKPLLP